jgi:glutaredoxin
MSSREVVLFGRDGCCLCDDARAILERVRARHRFALVERDIDGDETLLRAYLERIPVVAIDGVEVFELFVDESEFERRLGDRPDGPRTTSSHAQRPRETD